MDELNSAKWVGETKAFIELFKDKSVRLEKFSFDPWVSYFVKE